MEQAIDSIATVTVQRSSVGGIIDLTIQFTNGKITAALDEDSNTVTLNKNERLMATCLFNAGVDETGR
jgi:hypothetical protein